MKKYEWDWDFEQYVATFDGAELIEYCNGQELGRAQLTRNPDRDNDFADLPLLFVNEPDGTSYWCDGETAWLDGQAYTFTRTR